MTQRLKKIKILIKILAENCERDSAIFVEILTLRSWSHLVAVFDKFDEMSAVPFERVVRKGFSGSARDSLLTIYQFATDSDGYFADVLYNSMVGLGTRDRTLIRVVVTRAEIDMGNIKVAFINKYLKTLETTIDVSLQNSVKMLKNSAWIIILSPAFLIVVIESK